MGRTSSRVAPPVVRITALLQPTRRAHTLLLAALLLGGGAGCERLVMLGTDCPDQAGCQDNPEGDGEPPVGDEGGTGATNDAGSVSTGSDASILLPNGNQPMLLADAGSAYKLGNASFEATNINIIDYFTDPLDLSFGVDVYVNNGLGGVPLVGNLLFSRVAPWYACNSGTWALEKSGMGASEYRPSQGKWFLRMARINNAIEGKPNGLYQDVNGGFEAGLAYSFQVDALGRADEGATVQFRLGATNTPCAGEPGGASALSEPLEKQTTWKTLCLTFVPKEHLNTLYIVPQIVGGTSATAVAIDNVRAVERCP